uniref:ZMYM2-like/QRICH1 C-terminal domain-containing protein n=1 Tax=Amphimedon queenslandica TaxID=400682 RepID=A0A1X7TCK4_AMPQE
MRNELKTWLTQARRRSYCRENGLNGEISRMAENVNPNAAPTPKKRLSLSLKKRRTSERFGETSEEELHSMSLYTMPKNSATSSQWALKNLSDWREEYNRRHPDKICPEEVTFLSLSQLQRKGNPDRYVYTENSSKNKQGGLKQMRLDRKVVTVVANSKIGERCPVYILDKYISKLPDKAKEMDLFYCRAYPKLPKNPNDPWYIATPIGKNTLSTMVRDMCLEAGVEGEKSNHSLRVAGTSSLFAAGVPEKLIQSRTGHVSLTALRKYERITDEQELAVSKILTGDEDTYEKALKCSEDISMTCESSSSNVSSSGTRNADHIKDHTFAAPANPSVSYNNCTLNMYQTGPLPMMGYPPFPANPIPTWPQVPPYDPNFPPQVPLYEQWKDGEYHDSK